MDGTLALRLRAQGLSGPRCADVEAAVARLVGVQAQDLGFARLAFRPRCSPALTAADVDAALRERAVVWTWAMRGTLHLVRAADARWLLGLLGPIFAARGRPRRLALGLDDDLCERALARLRAVLAAEGPQTRAALAARLAIDRGGRAPAHLLAYAAQRGVICRGPLRGREPTYVLLDDWLGAPPAPVGDDDALAELGRRYLAGHGPARAQDLAAWSGSPAAPRRTARSPRSLPARLRVARPRPRPAPRPPHPGGRRLRCAGRARRRPRGRRLASPRRGLARAVAPLGDDVWRLERDREDVERFLAASP